MLEEEGVEEEKEVQRSRTRNLWTDDETFRLIAKRTEYNNLFQLSRKGFNSFKSWIRVKKEAKLFNRTTIQIKKRWNYLIRHYKEIMKSNNIGIGPREHTAQNWTFFQDIHQFFLDNPQNDNSSKTIIKIEEVHVDYNSDGEVYVSDDTNFENDCLFDYVSSSQPEVKVEIKNVKTNPIKQKKQEALTTEENKSSLNSAISITPVNVLNIDEESSATNTCNFFCKSLARELKKSAQVDDSDSAYTKYILAEMKLMSQNKKKDFKMLVNTFFNE